MRLGDLDALKEDLKQYFSDGTLESVSAKLAFNMILRKIDNAPTVDKGYDFGYADGHGEGYELGKNSRQQGEWIKWNFKTFGAMGDWEYKCSNCEKVYGGEYNFCPNCGADMRKGGAE